MALGIIIVNQNSGYLTVDVANRMVEKYENVVIFTGHIRFSERLLDHRIEIHNTVKYNRKSLFERIYSWLISTIHLLLLLATKYRKFDILYYSNPPISYWCSLLLKNKFSVVIFDAYPDFLKILGIRESNPIYKFWAAINKIVFKKASKIITLTESMKGQLVKYIEADKIEVISVWPSSEKLRPIPKEQNPFVKEHLIEDYFVVLYSGNIGLGQNVDVLLDVASLLKTETILKFLIIGEGSRKRLLQERQARENLDNVVFLTWQEPEILQFSLCSGDISVITLDSGASELSIPSKTFNYLAVGSPILCIAPDESELSMLVRNNNVGVSFEKQEISKIATFIKNAIVEKEKMDKFRQNSYNLSKKYSFQLSKKYLN